MSDDEAETALRCLLECLRRNGVAANGIRDWPKGQVLSVTVTIVVRHDGGRYHWREGLASCDHADTDPEGAAKRIAGLYRRLQEPSFTTARRPSPTDQSPIGISGLREIRTSQVTPDDFSEVRGVPIPTPTVHVIVALAVPWPDRTRKRKGEREEP